MGDQGTLNLCHFRDHRTSRLDVTTFEGVSWDSVEMDRHNQGFLLALSVRADGRSVAIFEALASWVFNKWTSVLDHSGALTAHSPMFTFTYC